MPAIKPLSVAFVLAFVGIAASTASAELVAPTPKYIHGGLDAWPADVPFPADSRWGGLGSISRVEESSSSPVSTGNPQSQPEQKTKFTPNDVRSVPAHTRLAYYARVNESGDAIYLCWVEHPLVPHRWFERDIAQFCEPGARRKLITAVNSGKTGEMTYHGKHSKIYVDANKRIRLMMTEGSPDAVYAVPAIFKENGEWHISKTSYGNVRRDLLLLGLSEKEP